VSLIFHCVSMMNIDDDDDDDDDAHISSQCVVCEKNLVHVTSLQATAGKA